MPAPTTDRDAVEKALDTAERLHDAAPSILPRRMMQAYCLRELYNVKRSAAIEALEMAPGTFDVQLSRGRDRVAEVAHAAELLEEFGANHE